MALALFFGVFIIAVFLIFWILPILYILGAGVWSFLSA